MITREGRFLPSLRLEDITDADSTYTKRVWKDFEIKNLGEYHGFYVQSDALLLVDVENKISFITDIGMLLMIEKDIRGRICHSIHPYAKAGNKYMKSSYKNK